MELNEVLYYARQLLKERTDSLQNDVRRCCLAKCEDSQYAPFPALLYCFSTIDLLGALYKGNAEDNSTKQSKDYMTEVMRYPAEKAILLQQVFRHKIVHLAQPNPSINIDTSEGKYSNLKGKIQDGFYSWAIEHEARAKHLSIETLSNKEGKGEFRFHVSIWSLVEDIVDSVYKPNGYLHQLETEKPVSDESVLRKKFKKAYNQIYEHKPLV